MPKKLPNYLTSYDLLKTVAVLTMVVDHIGLYFFPEQIEWRIVGRMSMPIWLFLIGYANTRQLKDVLWVGGGALLVANVVVGIPLFPLNILFTIMLARLSLDLVVRFLLMSGQGMFLGLFAMALIAIPTMFIVDYGTQALLFAVLGYMVRHQKEIGFSNERLLALMGTIFVIYIVLQKITFGFSNIEVFTMGAGVLLICLILSSFKKKRCKELEAQLPAFVVEGLKFTGRRTLEIYVAHLLLFKVMGLALFPERFPLFDFYLF